MSWIDELKVGDKVIVDSNASYCHSHNMFQHVIKRITPKTRTIVLGNDYSYKPNEAEACFLEYNEENIAKINAFRKYARVRNWLSSLKVEEKNTVLIDALYAVMKNSKC